MTNVDGYQQVMLWDKKEADEKSTGDMSRTGTFPVTTWESILNRPRIIEHSEKVVDTPNTPFGFVVVEEEEISDDDVYTLFNQIW